MRGGVRVAAFFCTSRTAVSRAARDSRPTAWSREARHAAAYPRGAREHPVADEIHDPRPGDAGVELHAGEPQRQHHERRAEEREHTFESVADQVAEDAAGAGRQRLDVVMQRRESATRREHDHEPDGAERNRRAPVARITGNTHEADPGAECDHESETDRPASRTAAAAGRRLARRECRSGCRLRRVRQ